MKNYYIVPHEVLGFEYWEAHNDGLLAKLGFFNDLNSVPNTISIIKDGCKRALKRELAKIAEPKREIEIVEI
jgi:hypothetical protein